MLSFNIQSISSKFNEFQESINSLDPFKFDIICLQELWRIIDPSIFVLDGYHSLVFKSREQNVQGGGVGIFVNKHLKFTNLPEYSVFIDKVVETIFIEIAINKKKNIIIGSVYRLNSAYVNLTSSQQLEQFTISLNSIINQITAAGKTCYLLGDFNVDILKINQHKPSAEYVNSLFSLGCLQLMTVPTRCINNSSTLIDHIVTNDCIPSYTCGALTNRISDHFPIFCLLNQTKPKVSQRSFITRHITTNSLQNFKTTLNNMSWQETVNSDDPQHCMDKFLTKFTDLYELHFPETTVKFN